MKLHFHLCELEVDVDEKRTREDFGIDGRKSDISGDIKRTL